MVFHKKLALWGKSEAQEEKDGKDRCHCCGQRGGRMKAGLSHSNFPPVSTEVFRAADYYKGKSLKSK